MLKNKLNLLVLINSVALLLIVFYLLFRLFAVPEKVVYVDNIKLFDGFAMTRESKALGQKEFGAKKKILDSLYLEAQSATVPEAQKKAAIQQFIALKEEFEQFNQTFGSQESEKIWKRIQGYTKDFSEEKGYDLILGGDTKRDVYYASEKVDITKELLDYLNKRYEGGN